MKYLALATDYDGTLAANGIVADSTLAALKSVQASGRQLILVTGRLLPELIAIFPELTLFDRVIAENGAVLYNPKTREEKVIGDRPPARFIQTLESQKIFPLQVGRVIVATCQPHEKTVLEVIQQMGLELSVIFNKGAVMVLPSGVNKGVALQTALLELQLSPHNVVGLGDGENDHAFLKACGCSVAVGNALPMLKEQADLVMTLNNGAGVSRICEELVSSDLAGYEKQLRNRGVLMGTRADQSPWLAHWDRDNLLIAGPSGSGKSTFVQGLLERCVSQQLQFCLIDAEGDYENVPGTIQVGTGHRAPQIDETIQLLQDPLHSCVINLIGLPLSDRPVFLSKLLPGLQDLRLRTGRPHWIIIDEAHHLIPSDWKPPLPGLPPGLNGVVLITVHPSHVASSALQAITCAIAIGDSPEKTLGGFSQAIQRPAIGEVTGRAEDQAVAWRPVEDQVPFIFTPAPAQLEHQRHRRKYAEGTLGEERSFYFRGPEAKLNLRAQNLETFLQLAEGVDDATWLFHLNKGHYAQWFGGMIKDGDLAREVESIREQNLSAAESRTRVKEAVQRRYAPSA